MCNPSLFSMKAIITTLILFHFNFCSAQDRNSIWCFGDSAGIDFRNTNNPVPYLTGMDGRGSCVSYSDSVGNLVLYSFTKASTNFISTHIYNSTDSMIIGADSITGEAWYNELVLMPKPNAPNLFYLFSIGVQQNINQGLYLTTIDINLNGGLGVVTQQNLQLENHYCPTKIIKG